MLESLQRELAPQVCERWLRPIRALSFDENRLTLSVPDEFFKNWIMDHYGGMISIALKDIAKDPATEMVFQIAEESLIISMPEKTAGKQAPTKKNGKFSKGSSGNPAGRP